MKQKKSSSMIEFPDILDNLGIIYITLLFISGVIWAFIAINNFETPTIFKLALIYSILLIFGFLGISYDRGRTMKMGLDSRIWEGEKIKKQLLIGIILFAAWYFLFMTTGFSVATAQSVTGGTLFGVSPGVNFFLTAVLGPIAENVFFFGVISITFITILRKIFATENKGNVIITALVILATIPLFDNVPNIALLISIAAGLTLVTGLTQNQFLRKHAPIMISAIIVGTAVFPKFHSFAYQLNERHYIAAQLFGGGAVLLAAYVGILPVDIIHILNNAFVMGGLA